jgi:hypothetical protein
MPQRPKEERRELLVVIRYLLIRSLLDPSGLDPSVKPEQISIGDAAGRVEVEIDLAAGFK